MLVDDDAAVRATIGRQFEDDGHVVDSVGDGRIALTAIEHCHYDLVIVDFAMPVMDGAAVIRAARKLRPDVKFLMVTGYSDSEAVAAACPDTAVLRKPFDNDALRALVFDLTATLSRPGSREPREQAAEVLAFVERDRAAIDFGDVADDGEAKAGAWLAGGVEPRAARENVVALGLGDAARRHPRRGFATKPPVGGLDRDEHPAAAIFGGILDEIAEHFVEVLALDADFDGLVAGEVDGDVVRRGGRPRAGPPRRSPTPTTRAWTEARRPMARARARWWSTWRRMVDASRHTVSVRSGALAVAALVMTVSGVLSAWARLPAWRRASSACASLCASSSLISSTSGLISLGKPSLMRTWLPERIAATSRRTRRSGHRP